jgi:hypothetical protein
MRLVNAGTAGTVGVLVTGAIAVLELGWVALGLASGALVAAGLLLVGGSAEKRFAGCGAVFVVGTGLAIHLTGWYPPAYDVSLVVTLLSLGSLSALVVLVVIAGERLLSRFARTETSTGPFELAVTVVRAIRLARVVLVLTQTVTRYAVIGVGGTIAFLLNALGIAVSVPIPLIAISVDLVLVVFVTSILVGFHTLAWMQGTWEDSKRVLSKALEARESARGARESVPETDHADTRESEDETDPED